MKHAIITSSSYDKGCRIAFDKIITEENVDEIKSIYKKIIDECGKDVSISMHYLDTDSESWDSIIKKDLFFKDVKLIKKIDEFINLIKKDRVLRGIDIAKYILCKISCTHLKLEKLVYLCYAEYLTKYDEKLFVDEIYAYKYGPVVKSVYDKFKKTKDDIEFISLEKYEMPARSRIMFAENGADKIFIVDSVIKKYGNMSASQLVDLTHKPLSPWDRVGRGEEKNTIIADQIIKKYHCNEI